MRVKIHDTGVALWLSARDTDNWASKPGAAWPCSTLAGHRVFAAFDRNGLCDFALDGRDGGCDGHELSAICADFLENRLPMEHPVWFVTVGQFRAA